MSQIAKRVRMPNSEKDDASDRNILHPVHFTEKEIAAFNSVSCRGHITVGIDIANPTTIVWVNLEMLSSFAKLYLHYWNRIAYATTKVAIKQRSIIWDILSKITYVYKLAIRHDCIVNQWVNIQKLQQTTIENKMSNSFLSTYQHNEYDVLEIEKLGLEHSKIEVEYDKYDESIINDIIMFSKLMAFTLHRIQFQDRN